MPAMSLLSLIGAQPAQAPTLVVGEDAPGKVQLSSNGDPAFATVMAAMEQNTMTAEQMKAFFLSKNMAATSLNLQSGDLTGTAVAATNLTDGQKLPAELLVASQQVTPAPVGASQQVIDAVSKLLDGADTMSDSAKQALIAKFPDRELTPEELSAIVQKTGAEPDAVFVMLQDTTAASPVLAAAMVDAEMAETANDAASTNLSAKKWLSMLNKDEDDKKDGEETQQNSDVNSAAAVLAAASVIAAPVQQAETIVQTPDLSATQAVASEGESEEIPDILDASKSKPTLLSSVNQNQQVTGQAAQTQAEANNAAATDSAANAAQKTLAAQNQAQAKKAASDSLQTALSNMPVPEQATSFATMAESATREAIPATQLASAKDVAAISGADVNAGMNANIVQLNGRNGTTAVDKTATGQKIALPENATEQVMVQVRKGLKEGNSKIEIRMQPEELGKVHVKIETAHDGASKITVTAERRETLDMLQRDSRSLERALQDTGLKTDSSSLSFNLRGDNSQQQQQQQQARQDQQNQGFSTNMGGSGNEGSGNSSEQQQSPSQPYRTSQDDLEERLLGSESALSYALGNNYRMGKPSGLDIRA